MQGLARYSDNSPSPPAAGPSRPRNDSSLGQSQRPRHSSPSSSHHEGVRNAKRRRSKSPENLTHTSQAHLAHSALAASDVAVYERNMEARLEAEAEMTEEEMFRRVTRPPDIDGLEDWGIPPEVDPGECSTQLRDKVAQFLDLKYSRGQHINTSLLSSTTFANPHIYAKLVEFVDLSERATAFPSGGWLTRQGLEYLRPKYGPKALGDEQKRKQEEVRKAQEVGKRNSISFAPGRHADDRDVRGVDRSKDNRDARRDSDRVRHGHRNDRDRRDSHRDRSGRYHKDGGWEERDMKRDKREWDRRR
ncbi:HCNGP-like protein-domain-containing protein [Kockovaella imperatae]|uniref:HCNGP-like protein-domain-containing protein n=1 Tax=Kockovaella imperatae TaxID=4999 RepID=A0A1Y1ULW4_9TREE|nr:HCNGP-like protein-domain-containing protein [Kockovaella imperatae]ORX38982.1 HCNGP-like protein-domain-containing protein [Kockovaella imperatae]